MRPVLAKVLTGAAHQAFEAAPEVPAEVEPAPGGYLQALEDWWQFAVEGSTLVFTQVAAGDKTDNH